MEAPSPLLDRAALERLERLAIRWRQSFQGLLGGNNVSRYAGVGHEFLDHRQFHQGDDLRAVNWRAYLRLGRLFLKMFRTEPRTPVRLLLDTSESMACGATAEAEAKFSYGCRLAAALCYIGLVRLESIVIQPFSDGLAESFRAAGGRHRFALADSFISGLRTGGRSDFQATVRQFLSAGPSRGLMIIISDFLDENDCSPSLQYLADEGQELLLIHLAGPEDCDPQRRGEFDLLDAETGEKIRMNIDQEIAREYVQAYDEHRRAIEYTAMRSGGRYLHLTTALELNDSLYGALMSSGSVALQ